MSDMELTLSREVAASPELVWAIVTDLDRAPEICSGIARVERLAGPVYDVGTRWRETRTMLGRETTEEMEVVGLEPGRSATLAAEAHGVVYRSVVRVEPSGAGSLLSMSFSGTLESPSWLQRAAARLTSRMGLAATRRAMQQDLDDIAAHAERVGG